MARTVGKRGTLATPVESSEPPKPAPKPETTVSKPAQAPKSARAGGYVLTDHGWRVE